jgi:hypothetical protein
MQHAVLNKQEYERYVVGSIVATQHTLLCAAPEQFAEYVNAGTDNSFSCERAPRFCFCEPAKESHMRLDTPEPWHRKPCDMTVMNIWNGNELPVPSENDALLESRGFWMALT